MVVVDSGGTWQAHWHYLPSSQLVFASGQEGHLRLEGSLYLPLGPDEYTNQDL